MKKELENFCKKRELVACYCNDEKPDNFTVGYIQSVFNDEFLINEISPTGEYNGYSVRKIDNVFLINTNSNYLDSIIKLYQTTLKMHDNFSNNSEIISEQLLKYAVEKKLVISFELVDSGNSDGAGFPQKVNKGIVTLLNLDSYGKYDGESVFKVDDITVVTCDREEDQKLKKLNELYQNLNNEKL